MEYHTGKRKEKRKRGRRRQVIAVSLVLLACGLFGIVYTINSQALPPIPAWLAKLPIVRAPAFPETTLTLNITATEPEWFVNYGTHVGMIQGNVVWDKPVFASASVEHREPFHATDGLDVVWESAEGTGSWLYVDLGAPTSFRILAPAMMIKADDPSVIETYYIASDDLKTWRVLYDETDYAKYPEWHNPVIVLPQSVTARYIGLYAQNWGNGQGIVDEFVVLQ